MVAVHSARRRHVAAMAVSMCSVTSQREPSSVTSGSEYLKRPLQHDLQSDMEADFEPAVKIKCPSGSASGGGRRKQSKPIRVRSDVATPPVEDLVVDMKLPATQSPRSPAMAETGREDDVETVSFDVDDQKPDPAVVAVFPTRYHQLGSELKQEVGLGSYVGSSDDADRKSVPPRSEMVDEPRGDLNDLKRSSRQEPDFVADTKSWNQFSDSFYRSSPGIQLQEQSFMSKSDCLPTNLSMRPMNLESPGNADAYAMQTSGRPGADVDMSRSDMQEAERFWEGSDTGSGGEKSRIFHPDAYCDICDREFCNKYFLKTHRANKHGIYDASSAADPGGYSSSAVPPAMSGLVFSQAALPGVEPPTPSDRERATSSSVSCSSSSSLSGVLPIPQLPSNLGMLPYDDAPPPPPPPPPTRSTDMEDYCDICQKHFCNKYYLRKHRQDVHGLSPADVASRRSQSDFSRGSSDMAAESSTAPHFPLRVSSSASSSTLPPPPPPPSALSNFPMFLPPPFGAPLPVVPPFLPGAAALGFSSLPFGGDASGSSCKMSTSSTSQPQAQQQQQQQQLSGATSSLLPGMTSADAYMDLLRKELLGGYLINNGDRDVSAAIAAVAAAAAAAASGNDLSVPGPPPPRLPPLPTGSEPSAPDTPANPTPDTFAEMLQRIGARIGKKNDGLGALHHDLFRLNGLGPGAVRLPASLTSTPASSSSSSRLVDRVVCDLCNKEVCNKYFLKTHKMKVHGWDPNTSTVASTSLSLTTPLITAESAAIKSEPQMSSSQSQPPLMYLPALPVSHVDKPPHFPPPEPAGLTPKEAELQKMGIDPEAYCEICRKEFCSKYFLRTHRQNIHGIQDSSSTSSAAGPITPLFSSVAQPFSSVVLPPPAPPLVSLPSSSLSTNCSTPSSSSSLFLFGGAGLASTPADSHLVEQRSWKWKEPVNATRVSCTLCNKVLCNKYFLRTHMAKRHGVTVDTVVQPPPAPAPVRDVLQPPSSGQHASTNGIHQFSTPSSVDTATVDAVDQREVDCCPDGGKTGAVNLMLSGRTSADVQTVTARTWQVPASDTPPQSDSDASTASVRHPCDDVVKCPLCTTAMSDREILLRHLTAVHHVDEQMSVSLVTAVAESSGSPGSASTSLDGFMPQSQVPRPPTMGGGGVMRRRRQFRCAFCRERFRTRVHCELHARAAHPRASGSCVEVTPAVDTVDRASPPLPPPSSSNCMPAAVYATPLDANDAGRTQMLPYVLRELLADDAELRFSTALVYLPTFRPLTAPTTITFTLTPIIQPAP